MDALEFAKERKRMCRSHTRCLDCPLKEVKCNVIDESLAIVEQWSKDHPRKTRQSVFLEQWPDAVLDRFGVIRLCLMEVSAAHRRRGNSEKCRHPEKMCIDCRREFWMQEVE